jgi:hypothetical protein
MLVVLQQRDPTLIRSQIDHYFLSAPSASIFNNTQRVNVFHFHHIKFYESIC